MYDRDGSTNNRNACLTGKEVQITAANVRQGRKYKQRQHMSDREGSTNNANKCQTGKEVQTTPTHVRQGRGRTEHKP